MLVFLLGSFCPELSNFLDIFTSDSIADTHGDVSLQEANWMFSIEATVMAVTTLVVLLLATLFQGISSDLASIVWSLLGSPHHTSLLKTSWMVLGGWKAYLSCSDHLSFIMSPRCSIVWEVQGEVLGYSVLACLKTDLLLGCLTTWIACDRCVPLDSIPEPSCQWLVHLLRSLPLHWGIQGPPLNHLHGVGVGSFFTDHSGSCSRCHTLQHIAYYCCVVCLGGNGFPPHLIFTPPRDHPYCLHFKDCNVHMCSCPFFLATCPWRVAHSCGHHNPSWKHLLWLPPTLRVYVFTLIAVWRNVIKGVIGLLLGLGCGPLNSLAGAL